MQLNWYSVRLLYYSLFTCIVRAKTCRKLVGQSEDLCIFYHHHINHSHSCCLQTFSPLIFPWCWVWCSSTEMNPCFQTSISFTSSPFVTLTPTRLFQNVHLYSTQKVWTLFLSSSPVIFSIVWFSCPTFSTHELGFNTFTVFLASASLKWNTLSKELSGSSPFQQVGTELLLFQVGKRLRELLTGVNKHP